MAHDILKKTTAAGLGSLMILITANTAVQAAGLAAGLKASSQGIGLELTGSVGERLNVRIGANYFKLGKTLDKSGNEYDFDLKLKSFNALADWHVFGNGFRLTGGAVIDKNTLDGQALDANSYDIGGMTFTSAEVGVLTGNINFRDVSPYMGIGWGNPLSKDSGWTFMADLGVVFTGTARVDLTSTGGTLSNDPAFLAEVAREENDVRDDLDGFKYYPVLSLGFSYRF